jgi:DNA-binding CsgD family transcriptional regulator
MSKKDQILALVAEGKTTPEIAKLVGVSVNTVRYHREPSKKKVGLRKMVKYLYDRAKAEDAAGR